MFGLFSKTPEGATIGINKNNLLLRGCVLRNTSAVVGVVVYAGQYRLVQRVKLKMDYNIFIFFTLRS